MTECVVSELDSTSIPSIHALEKCCWPIEMQATPDRLANRFAQGHQMLGAFVDGQLVGLIAFRLRMFDPEDLSDFPQTFDEFASGKSASMFNTVFGYNMSIHPSQRGRQVIQQLLREAIAFVRKKGCRYIVGDGRCPSYNGTMQENKAIKQSPVFRQAIDRYLHGGVFPSLDEFLADPALRFFYRTMHCRFIDIRANFLPGDKASGGHRVIYCVDLD